MNNLLQGENMQTINVQVEVEDSLYEDIKKQGIDLQAKFQELIVDLKDDGYPAISTKEAKERVSKAVEDYKNGNMKTLSHEEAWSQIDKKIENNIANNL
jgi:hypothetical protein